MGLAVVSYGVTYDQRDWHEEADDQRRRAEAAEQDAIDARTQLAEAEEALRLELARAHDRIAALEAARERTERFTRDRSKAVDMFDAARALHHEAVVLVEWDPRRDAGRRFRVAVEHQAGAS